MPNIRKHYFFLLCCIFSSLQVVFLQESFADWEEETHQQAEQTIQWKATESHGPNVSVHLLAINDFHSQITAGETVAKRPVGSAPVLAAYLHDSARSHGVSTFILHAGDHVGASQPQSTLMQDEPGITFFNMLGNAGCKPDGQFTDRCNLLGVPGNHELDEGPAEMMRLIHGGNHSKGPFLKANYQGANFPYLCANLIDTQSGQPLFAPYTVRTVKGVRIAFIGAILKNAGAFLSPESLSGLTILDEAETINHYTQILKNQGIHAIAVVIHQGGYQGKDEHNPSEDRLRGDIASLAGQLDGEIDVVFGGHTHTYHNIFVENAGGKKMLVTQAWPKGGGFADVELKISATTGEVTRISSKIVTTWADRGPGLRPNPKIVALAEQVETRGNELASQIVARATRPITRTANKAGESALGDLIADAQRQVMDTDFAFMQIGGIKADILPGGITRGDHYHVQPYNWNLIRLELTGQQIYDLLNQQWQDQNGDGCVLQVSGLTYIWDAARPAGERVVDVFRAGKPIDRLTRYSVAVNEYLAGGGDNFTVLTRGENPVVGPFVAEALLQYVQNLSQPVDSTIEGRISRLN